MTNVVASIANGLFASNAQRADATDTFAPKGITKSAGGTVASRDSGPAVTKTFSPQGAAALQLLGGSNLFQPPSSQSRTQKKPFIGEQLIDTLTANGASAHVINALTEAAKKDQDEIDGFRGLLGNLSKSKKGDASERLHFAREQLRLLRQFGGDPKVIARIAADIARDVASAASEYADAGGVSADELDADASAQETAAVAQSAPSSESQDQVEPGASDAATAGTDSDALASAGDSAATSQTDTTLSNAQTQSGTNKIDGSTPAVTGTSASTATDTKDSQSGNAESKSAQNDRADNGHKTNGALTASLSSKPSEGDDKFAQEVRALLKELQAVLQHALAKAKEKKGEDSGLDQIKKQFDSASREADYALNLILGGGASLFNGTDTVISTDSVNVQAQAQIQISVSVNIIV